MRHCGNCGKTGHYRSTCKGAEPDQPKDVTNLKEKAVNIIKEISEKQEPLPNYCGGLKPRFDPIKFPNLHSATERGNVLLQKDRDNWLKVIDLKAQGKNGSADRLIRKIFGLQEPMSEEDKEKLRLYNLEHKEEIAERAKQKREFEKRTKELLDQSSRKLDKKRSR